MKKISILVAAMCYCGYCSAQNKDANEIKKLNAEWIPILCYTEIQQHLSRIYADDIILTNPSGARAVRKKELLNNVVRPGHDEYVST